MGRTVLSASSATQPALEGYQNHGVYTYALLEGLGKADANGDGLITVTELAEYVESRVPELSFQIFNMRQTPQMRIVGSPFPVAKPTDLLGADAHAPVTTVSTVPTHVITRPTEVYSIPSTTGIVLRTLPPGTVVTLVLADGGWALI